MPGPFSGIHTAASALRLSQLAMDTIGNNLANVNTPGYTRQRVDLKTAPTVRFESNGMKELGSGVSLAGISRARDFFVDRNASVNFAAQGRSEARASALSQMEGVYGEPSESGISASLGKFFDAWSQLGSNPANPANRLQVRGAAATLAERIRTAASSLSNLQRDTSQLASQTIQQINRLTRAIGEMNQEIVQSGMQVGGEPNALMDARNQALDDLSRLLKVEYTIQPDGSMNVFAGSLQLASVAGSTDLPPGLDPTQGPIDPAVFANIRGGAFYGQIESLNDIGAQVTSLNALANQIRTEINGLHQTGQNALGATGVSFFDPAGTDAGGLRLSAEVTASADAIAAGTTGRPGDGGLAQALGRLRDSALTPLAGKTFESYFQGLVFDLAESVRTADATLDTDRAVGEQILNQRQAVSGVNLDEEFANLVRFQRSYQAAAKALSIFDQTTQDLLAMIR